MAYTPGRVASLRAGGGGYYADPSSPIASTPQRGKPAVVTTRAAPSTPSLASLSPMRPVDRPLQRHAGEDEKTGAIFSPAFKFEDEKATTTGGAGALTTGTGAAAMPSTTTPTLAAAPPARKPATTGYTVASYSAASSTTVVASRAGGGASSSSTVSLAHRAAVSLSLHSDDSTTSTATTISSGTTSGASGGTVARTGTVAATGAGRVVAAPAPAVAATAYAPITPAPADDDDSEDQYEYEYEEFNPYLFIKLLPDYRTVAPRVPRIVLPKKRAKAPEVTLVLDLDETLVHCSVDPIPDADVTFPVMFNGCNYQVYVRKRPHLDKFLQWIAGRFEVVIFTASQQVYAERLLDLLDPSKKYIEHRLYRDSCLNVDGNYLKDLNVLGRDLTKAVLVDNSPHAFGYQLDNGVPIESWFDDRTDTELLKLIKFLETIVGASDVRPFVRDKFRVHKLVEEA